MSDACAWLIWPLSESFGQWRCRAAYRHSQGPALQRLPSVLSGKVQEHHQWRYPRRWLLQANPPLSKLITSAIGPDWVCDLSKLAELAPLAEDAQFRRSFAEAKIENKRRLARYVLRKMGMGINPHTLFDCQFKRMHEYKRQLLNILHVITRYNRIKDQPDAEYVPRTVLMGGKAAPGYHQAKLIIKLFHSVAEVVNNDPEIRVASGWSSFPTTASPRPRRSFPPPTCRSRFPPRAWKPPAPAT